MAVALTFTMTSLCCTISGSGTVSTLILRVPCQVTARIVALLSGWRAADVRRIGAPTRRRRDLAGLHQLLELAQVFPHLAVGILAEQLRDHEAELPGRRLHVHHHLDGR